jgi:hypothetical protein
MTCDSDMTRTVTYRGRSGTVTRSGGGLLYYRDSESVDVIIGGTVRPATHHRDWRHRGTMATRITDSDDDHAAAASDSVTVIMMC